MDESVNTQSTHNPPSEQLKEGGDGIKRKFGPRSNAIDVVAGLDLNGKTALVTGTNSGIGIETARTLSLCGAHVVMANRNLTESENVREQIKLEKPDAKIDLLSVDLSSLESVQSAANEFLAKEWPLHILVLNAGVFAPQDTSTKDGYDRAFGVNHLGHFYLTYLLLPRIRQSTPARIVIVSSTSHNHTGLNASMSVDEKLRVLIPPANNGSNWYRVYAYSKLCNVLMAMKLHRMEHDKRINVYVLHPGSMIGTGISRRFGVLGRMVNVLTRPLTKSLQQGAATTLYCAASDDLKNESGKYYEGCFESKEGLSVLAHDIELQDALWNKSKEMVQKFEESQTEK